jgi:chromosome segregation ATPase
LCIEGVATAREGWVHSDTVRAQLEKIRQEHAKGLELVQKENDARLADAIKEKDEAVKAFATLERTASDEAKQLKIERSNTLSDMERLQAKISDVTRRIIGWFFCFRFDMPCCNFRLLSSDDEIFRIYQSR